MNLKNIYIVMAGLALVTITSPAFSETVQHDDCGGTSKVSIDNYGKVNEARLKAIIADTEKSLSHASLYHGHGTRLEHTRPIKQHLGEYQEAMQTLHDEMYKSGCKAAKHGASVEARLEVLESKLSAN